MKKILITITNFRHGGTNKSLENLLSLIDINRYQVDVFAMEHFGPYKTILPNCNILKKDTWVEALIAHWSDTKGSTRLKSLLIKVTRNFCKYFNFDVTNFVFKNAAKQLSKNKEYDAVVAFSEGVPTAFTAHFENQNRIAWIRCDYSRYLELNNFKDETKIYISFKSIVCVSQYTKEIFCRIIPSVSNRVLAIHNVLNTQSFVKKSKIGVLDNNFTNEQFNIVSIGRIDPVKRFSKIPMIARTLIDKGCKFKWYLIGGSEAQSSEQLELLKNIKEYNVENFFYWIGSKDNPYPYISQSNLLVSLSTSEACPNVINESKTLIIPVVCTDFGSATEFIEDNINGFISPIEQIAEKIELLIKNKDEYNRIKNNLSKFTYNNEIILNQVYKLIE